MHDLFRLAYETFRVSRVTYIVMRYHSRAQPERQRSWCAFEDGVWADPLSCLCSDGGLLIHERLDTP